ncbi:MAG: ComF family protein [Bacillota bacterium]
MSIISFISELLFPTPRICPFCRKPQERLMVCMECNIRLEQYVKKLGQCTRCGTFGKPGTVCDNCRDWPQYLISNFAAVPYEKSFRDSLQNLKFKRQGWLAPALVEFMTNKYSFPSEKIDFIIPVPLHKKRLKERGFNQSALLGKELAKGLNLTYVENLLVRQVDTPHQTGLLRNERRNNLIKAFTATDNSQLKGKTILLVDDVITTGTTIRECAKTLYKAGSKHIYSITFAAGIK